MRVYWTDRAKARLWKIHDEMAKESPRVAQQEVARLLKRSRRLTKLPYLGREVPEYRLEKLRELLERPYRIVYYLYPDQIDVITVMHYRQLLPTDIEEILASR